MKEPTKEQLKKFWEWCGLQVTHEFIGTTGLIMTICKKCGKGTNFKNDLCRAPKLDLNNLFQYAVSKAVLKYMADYRVPESRAISYLFQAWQLEYRKVRQFEIALFNVLWLVAFGEVIK